MSHIGKNLALSIKSINITVVIIIMPKGGDSLTGRNEVYRCLVCGNIVEVLHAGPGELVCCGQPMKLQVANTVDASYESMYR